VCCPQWVVVVEPLTPPLWSFSPVMGRPAGQEPAQPAVIGDARALISPQAEVASGSNERQGMEKCAPRPSDLPTPVPTTPSE
jgi:hypothetical protein